jgi:hypothetical protein
MSLQSIYDALNAALRGGNIALGAATVPGLDLTLEAIGITGTGTLALTDATLALEATAVLLSGVASYRNFQWSTTLSGLSLDPDDPAQNGFTLVMQGLDATTAWHFATSFANLPSSRVVTDRGTLPVVPSVVGPLVVTAPALSVTTQPPRPEKPYVPRLQGSLVLTGSSLAPYADYFAAATLRLDGTVNFADPLNPVVTAWAAAPGAASNLPVIALREVGIKLQSDYPDAFALDEGTLISVAAFYARIDVSRRQGIVMEVTAPLLQGDFVWPVAARLTPPITASSGLDLVLEFFGQPPTSADLFSFPLADTLFRQFGLSGVEIGIQPPLGGCALGLLYASMQFESTEDWHPTLAFITVKQIGTGWTYHWYGGDDGQFVTGNVWGRIVFFDDPTLEVTPLDDQCSSNKIEILVTATIPDFKITGSTESEICVPVGAVLKKYLGGSGGISDNLRITRIVFQAIPTQQWYQASMMVDGIWSITLSALNNRTVTFSLDRVIGELEMAQNRIFGSVTGWASLIVTADGRETTKAVFVAGAEYRPSGEWHFAGGLAEGTLNVVDFATGLLGIAPSVTLPEILLKELWLEYTATGGDNPYSARGTLELRWNLDVLGLKLSLEAKAAIARQRKTTRTEMVRALASPAQTAGDMIYVGSLSGKLQVNSLAVTVGLSFVDTETVYYFEVQFKRLTVRASTEWVKDKKPKPGFPSLRSFLEDDDARHQIIVITLSGFTLGEVVEYLVGLANPNVNYTLEAPWTFLNEIDLSRFALRIDPKEQTIALTYAVKLNLAFIELTSIGVLYDRSTGEGTVNFVLEGRFLGKTYSLAEGNPLSWDAINDPPPQIPGKGAKLFDLRYLAAGQHITLSDLTQFNSVTAVLGELRKEMQPPKSLTGNPFSASKIRFDPLSQWMFGLDCTIMDTVSVGVILHDPDLYGLVVSLAGPEAKSLAGLSFELLYKKITNDVGVFRVRLQVPDSFRQINFGYVSITLGIVSVDIFTNGNFKIDLGFPHNRDFSDSFGVEAGPFIGNGGLYFGLLDGATSSRVPAITNGTFDPVLELGLGLAVGVGRTFNKGPLKAGLYVELVAIFEGVLGWFHPTDEAAPKAMYYWAQGTAGLIGKLYGTVDFKIIKVSVSVEAHALVSITFAACRETLVELDIGVEVEAEVTILFVTISFSFGLQLTTSFTIGASSPTPWILANDQGGRSLSGAHRSAVVPRRRRPHLVAEQTRRIHLRERYGRAGLRAHLAGMAEADALTWPIVPVFPDGKVHPVVVKMLPAYGVDQVAVQWPQDPAPVNAAPAYRIAFLLMAENGVAPEARTIAEKCVLTAERSAGAPATEDLSFNVVVEAMLRWSLAAMGLGPVAGNVTPGQLAELVDQLDSAQAATSLDMTTLGNFFGKNIELRVSAIPSGTTPSLIGGTAFPVPPPLGWDASTGDDDSRRFNAFRMVDPSYGAGIQSYFAELDPTPTGKTAAPVTEGTTESMATFVFRDYFLMIAKAAVQAAQQIIAAFPYVVTGVATESLTSIAAAFPTVTDQYVKRAGDTVDQVADAFAMTRAELIALNPGIEQALRAAAVGTEIAVTLGVTPESLAAGNPASPVVSGKALQLGDIVHQIADGESLNSIAATFGADIDGWFQQPDLLDQRPLLRDGAALNLPQSSFVNTGALDLGLVAAFIYVRCRGVHDLNVVGQDGVPLVEWYVQAIGDLNPIWGSALLVPRAYDNLQNPLSWTLLPGDDIWSVAATFAVYQNQAGNTDFAAWLQAVTALNPGSGPFGRVNLPAGATAVFAGDTLSTIALRLPLELPSNGGWLDQPTSFRGIVKAVPILLPLASVTVPDCTAQTTANQTLAILATRYALAIDDLGRRVAGVGGLLAVQKDKTFVVPHPPSVRIGGTTATVADLVPQVLREGATVAGQVSRYLLSGLRMPAPKDGKYDPDGAMTGLYELTGQQLVGPSLPAQCPPATPTPRLTITIRNFESGANWLKLYDSTTLNAGPEPTAELHRLNPGLASRASRTGLIALTGEVDHIVFQITDADTCAYYPAPVLQQTFINNPAALRLYADVAVRHAVQQQILWQTTESIDLPNPKNVTPPLSAALALWPFSAGLMDTARAFPSKAFALCNVDPQLGPSAVPAELALYAWATIVDIRIRTIAGLPNTYEVFGADTADRQLLRQLWQYLKPPQPAPDDSATIHLLYQESRGSGLAVGLTSRPVRDATTYLIKANLTTQTQSGNLIAADAIVPPTFGDYYARLADAPRFLELMWECSVVGGGGYWLQYATSDGSPMPPPIFAADGTATVSLLVTLAKQMDASAPVRLLHAFNNIALVGNGTDASSSNLFARVADLSETQREATVGPGNVGFSLSLQTPPKATWPTIDKQIAIRQLYSLIAYQLQATGAFKASRPGMPVGPRPPKRSDGTLDETTWELFQVVPIWRYATGSALPTIVGLPSPDLDPYAGISSASTGGVPKMAETNVRLWFQDVLGNASQSTGTPVEGGPDLLSVPVGYTDPVIGVGAWPAATSFFHVGSLPNDPAAQLTTTVALQASTHLPAGQQRASDAVRTALDHLERYTRIWYQLMQPYVTARLLTTLQVNSDKQPYALDTQGDLRGFVSAACAWLGTASRLLDVTVDVTLAPTLAAATSVYGVGYDGLAAANGNVPLVNIFPPPATPPVEGTDVTIPVFGITMDGDTTAITVKRRSEVDPVGVLKDSRNTLLPLRAATELVVPDKQITTPADPVAPAQPISLATIAKDNAITLASLVSRNATLTARLRTGFAFTCEGIDVVVTNEAPDVSLQDVAATFQSNGVQYDAVMVAGANADKPGMFRPSVTLTLDRYLIGQGETLAHNGSGIDVPTLAPLNINTPNLFWAGTPLYLTFVPAGDAFRDSVSVAAGQFGVSAAQLLAQNASVALKAVPSPGPAYLAIPGHAALPAAALLPALRLPYAIAADATLSGIAALFLNADSTQPSAAVALALANLEMPGVLAGGKTIAVDGQQVQTQPGDSFATLLTRFAPPVPLADLVAAIASPPGFLQQGGLLLTPPAKLPTAHDAYAPNDVAALYGVGVGDIANGNSGLAAIVKPGVTLVSPLGGDLPPTIQTGAADSFVSLVWRFAQRGVQTSVSDILAKNATVPFISGGALMILPPPAASLTARFGGAAAWSFPESIFDIRAWIEIARDATLVDENFRGAGNQGPAVLDRASIPPVPKTLGAVPSEQYLALQAFALDLETAVPALRAATGKVAAEQGPSTVDVWAVAFGTGYISKIAIAPGVTVSSSKIPRYFALRPLENALVTKTGVAIKPLTADGNLGAAVLRDFQGVDLEVWAGRVLADIDLFGSAAYASAVYRTPQRQQLETILRAKQSLAASIARGLDYVLDFGQPDPVSAKPPDWVAACAALRQRLLVSLAAGYGIDAIVQYDTNVASPWSTDVARLSGPVKLGPGTPAQRRLEVGSAKTSLATTPENKAGYVSFLIDVAQQEGGRSVAFDPSYVVNEIEFNVADVIDGYQASDWLGFVRRFDQNLPAGVTIDLGQPQIPLPLRGYPLLPALRAQVAEPTHAAPASYADALLWDYAFTYQHQSAAVDQMNIEVRFNLAPLDLPGPETGPSLFEALAQYNQVAPDLWTLLNGLLRYDTAADKPTIDNAVASFATIVDAVAQGWNAHWTAAKQLVQRRQSVRGPTPESYAFRQTLEAELVPETGASVYKSLYLKRLKISGTLDWPLMSVVLADGSAHSMGKGVDTDKGRKYDFPANTPAFGLLGFEMRLSGLPIASYQNASAQVQVVRNAYLSDLAPTRPAFVYQTGWLAFPSMVTPLLTWRRPFTIATWNWTPASNALNAFFATLFGADSANRLISTAIRYSYELAVGSGTSIAPSLPVKLRPKFEFVANPANPNTVGEIVGAIKGWYDIEQPVTTGGAWLVTINFYSGLDGQLDRPLLEISLASPLA